MTTAIVFGASGISGISLIDTLLEDPAKWTKIVAVSRRPPPQKSEKISHVSVDLLNSTPDEIAGSLVKGGAGNATHAFFFSYIAKENEDDLINTNYKLFSNSVEALYKGTTVQAFLLQTGYKYYGAFVGGDALQPYPWVENSGRSGKNFYYQQEDYLKAAAEKYNWKWVVARPNFITGVSLGNFMSIATTVALYAVACNELNTPFYFPGSKYSYNLQYDHSNAKNNAEFEVFALDNPKAANRAFNIQDGKPSSFAVLWPKIAKYFGIVLPDPVTEDVEVNRHKDVKTVHSVQKWAEENKDKFGGIIKKYNLDPQAYEHATWAFLDGATSRTWPDQGSLDAAREIGWNKSIDSYEDGYKAAFCDSCRRKKTRCDGVFPNKCSNCKDNCTYNDTEPKKMYKVSYVEELKATLAQCQALLDNSSISHNTDDSLKRKHSISTSDNSRTTDIIPSTDYCDLYDEELARNINGLYIPSDDVRTGNRNFGKASMRGLFERITFYTGMASDALTHQRRFDFWVEDWEKELSSNLDSHNTDYTDEDFGSDEVLYHLVDVYFRMVNVTLPLLNETRFKANIPSRKLEKEFGSVLLMVCALGAIFSGDKSFVIAEKEHLQFLAGFDYYKVARKKMKDFFITPATLEDVQALILLQVYVDQGVHTKSSWMIHACFGKPLLLKDEDIYLELPQPYGNEDAHGNMGVFYMSEMIKLCKIHGQVMQKVYKYRKSIDCDDHVLTMTDIASLHSKLHAWLDQMPDFLHICKDDNETDFIMQLRSNLRLAYYTIQIFMYKPFLPNPTLRNPSNFQFTSLLICANASRSIIGNCKEVVLKRNLNKIYVDSMMDWGML
ncbi:hypothetical protein E3Q17_02789 [Wallemia mellicola]|uniref:Zn(2)-C6 fungal-type domain-containing protein n=1 Tax=Wallemia mellicola TaxID=1708541 RepID=A0A4T0NQE8_9BASI|nr:hypothetical protein E3Q17_02789 [Wallemia mellicola]